MNRFIRRRRSEAHRLLFGGILLCCAGAFCLGACGLAILLGLA